MAYGNINVPGVSRTELEAVKTIANEALENSGSCGTIPMYICHTTGLLAEKTTDESLGTELKTGTIFAVHFTQVNKIDNPSLVVEGIKLPVMTAYMNRNFVATDITAGVHLFMVYGGNAMLLNPATTTG